MAGVAYLDTEVTRAPTTGDMRGINADPGVNDPDGDCPSEHNVAHKRSTACAPLPSPPHSPVLRQMDGEGTPDEVAPQ